MPGPYPNKFKAFNTMTYSVSIYIQDPQHYQAMVANKIKDVTGLTLLIQSGGIDDVNDKGNYGAKRSIHFRNDFYLDNIQFQSYISGTTVQAPHNSYELNFTITEPAGITFLSNLNAAIQEHNKDIIELGSDINYLTQNYLMVIRFYGYDEKGNQISGEDLEKNSDSRAFSEKWIPFTFKNITFRLESDKVVYACTAVPVVSHIANDQIHGTIPFNMSFQGQNLKDILDGSQKNKQKGVVSSGLVSALNRHQEKLVSMQHQSIADQYAVEFAEGSKIGDALLAAPGTTLLARTGMPGGDSQSSLMKASTGSSNINKASRTFSVNAGMKIMKFLDFAIRSSTYISDQYKKINDQNADNTSEIKKKDPAPLKWFKIRPRLEILGYDKLRKNWAYKTTYVISDYTVKSVETTDFNSADCFDVTKEYDFWFTGQNTEVLSFFQEYDALYYTTFSNKHTADSKEALERTNSRLPRAYRVNTNEDNQGGKEGLAAEQAANAASVLYSPKDQSEVTLDIVGDPDWIAQSEIFYSAEADLLTDPILPDGSVNYDVSEVYFSVNFNTVVDYDIYTGLADVTQKNVVSNPLSNPAGVSQYSFVYRANLMSTELSNGKFTQRLHGTLMFVPDSCLVDEENPEQDTTREGKEVLGNTRDTSARKTVNSAQAVGSSAVKGGNNVLKTGTNDVGNSSIKQLVNGVPLNNTQTTENTPTDLKRQR